MTAPHSTRTPVPLSGVGGTPSARPASRTAGEGAPGPDAAPSSGSPGGLPAPDDLKDGGRALWESVTGTYALRSDELPLLAEMARTVDDLATLRSALADTGLVSAGSKGQARAHPLLAEVRGLRLLLLRLAAQLGLPDEDEPAGATPASRKAAKAANARWRREAVRDGEA